MFGRMFAAWGGLLLLLSCVAGAAAFAKATACQGGQPPSRSFSVGRPATLYFESGSRKIRADRYAPVGTPSHRAVIVLYGAGGMVFDGPSMKRVARALAEAGDTVYLLHYYNRTDTIVALDSTMRAHFGEWLATLHDGIAWVHGREEKRPILLFREWYWEAGHSLSPRSLWVSSPIRMILIVMPSLNYLSDDFGVNHSEQYRRKLRSNQAAANS